MPSKLIIHVAGLTLRVIRSGQLADGWAGPDSVPPAQAVLSHAYALLGLLPHEDVLALQADDIVPTPYGTLTLDWGEEISVELGNHQLSILLVSAQAAVVLPATPAGITEAASFIQYHRSKFSK